MNIENKTYIEALDIPFEEMGENEAKIITNEINRNLIKGFKKRLIYSALIAVVVCIFEIIGRINQNRNDSIPGVIIAFIIFLVIFNLLSYGYVILKKKMDVYSAHSVCVYTKITEKYEQNKLSKENKQKSKNYVILESDHFHCTTAFPIEDYTTFKNMKIGDDILLVKSSPYGNIQYDLYKIN